MTKGLSVASFIVAGLLYAGLPGIAADRQLQISPTAQAPGGERRVALVIGNSAYKTSPLRNPVNDARAIGKALAATGFKVTVVEDATQTTMRRVIRSFGDELAAGGIGVFYYAGHGMQVKGKNFLIPVNADIEREDEVEDGAVDANFVLSKMDSAKNALNLVILDACRNNPFARSFRSGAQGLAQMDAPSGTLIAFATAPGSVAADGDGENGLYTKHLLANLARPGLPVEQLFKEVRIGVTRDTKDRQVPWESSSLKGNFFFVPGEATLSADEQRRQIEKQVSERVAAEKAEVQRQMQKVIQEMLAKQRADLEEELKRAGAPKPAGAAPDPLQMELAFWDSIKNSSNPKDFEAYIAQYPKGTFVALARMRAAPATVAAAPKPEEPKPAATVVAIVPPPKPAPSLKPVEPAKPVEIAAPIEKPKPAPVQVASIAPTNALVGMGIDDPRFPKIGDRWQYRYTNLGNNQTTDGVVEVNAVSQDGILDTGRSGNGEARSRAHSAAPSLAFLAGGNLQFSPYLLSFGKPNAGDTWRNLDAQGAGFCRQAATICNFQAKVVGAERVTTPAGTFDAVKIVLDLNATLGGTNRVWRVYEYWFAEKAKRVVKSTGRTRIGVFGAPDYDVELVSYQLN
ncbi:MAG: caspase family protein [Betaproteobacteria bacterium]|nr:caspase family protein [Betaproteobacteria bacterium]